MEESGRRLENIDVADEVFSLAAHLQDLGEQPDRAVVEDQGASRHLRFGTRTRTQCDHREITIGDQQLLLHVEKVADALSGRAHPIVLFAKPLPSRLLDRLQLVDQQLFLALHVAIDGAGTHVRALRDLAQGGTVEALLAEELHRSSAEALAALPPAHESAIVVSKGTLRLRGR